MTWDARALAGVLAAALGVGAALPGCGTPQGTGTKTNFLQACHSEADCGSPTSCLCGLCTVECSDDAECESGVCGARLASIDQCDGVDQGRFCLPDASGGAAGAGGSCSELPVPAVDALGPAVEQSCSAPGALLCESFDAPLPPEYGVWHEQEIATSIQDCRVWIGSGALRFQSPAVGWTQVQMALPEPIVAGPLHARFYAYVPSGIPISTYLIMLELWAQDSADRFTVQAVGNDQMEIYLGPTGNGYAAAAGTLLRDQWMCIELALELADPNGAATLSVDGVPVVEQNTVLTQPATPLSVVVVSALPGADAAGVDLTLDELVVATEPIGCL